MNNPFEAIEKRLERIETLLLDIKELKKQEERPKVFSIKQLAEHCGVAPGTVRNWITMGKLKATTIGRRIFIHEDQFEGALSEVKSLKYKR